MLLVLMDEWRRSKARAAPRGAIVVLVAVHGYATKFLPLGGHEHMFWVFESAQKILPLCDPSFLLFPDFFFLVEQQVYFQINHFATCRT